MPPVPPLAIRLLQLCVVCQCLGNAWWFAGSAWPQIDAAGTPLFALLWSEPELGGLGWSEQAVQQAHGGLSLLWIVLAALVAWRPLLSPLAMVTLLQLLIAAAMVWTEEGFRLAVPWAPWAEPTLAAVFPLFAQSARIAAPLALGLLTLAQRRGEAVDSRLPVVALECGRWAIVATFVAHGLEAAQHNPAFIDLILLSARRVGSGWIGQSGAEGWLTLIGGVDLLAASVLAWRRSPWVAGYMAVWGLITAASRMIAYGVFLGGWGFATRAPHAVVPAVLLLCWTHSLKTAVAADRNPSHANPTQEDASLVPTAK